MKVKGEDFGFDQCEKMWKKKVKREDFRFYQYSENVENETSRF